MRRNKFFLKPANDYIWNQQKFVDFLIANKGKPISVDTNQEGVDLISAGVYKLLEQFNYQDVVIITNNLIESHPKYQIKHKNPFKFFSVSQTDYSKYHYWSKKKYLHVYLTGRCGIVLDLPQKYNVNII
jgi:hypothetical protein